MPQENTTPTACGKGKDFTLSLLPLAGEGASARLRVEADEGCKKPSPGFPAAKIRRENRPLPLAGEVNSGQERKKRKK